MKRIGRGVMMLGAVMSLALPVWAAGTLDGKTFSGQIGPQGQTNGKADDFVFQDGSFASTLCEMFGYGQGAYAAAANGDAIAFTAETSNQKGGTMQWKGLVKGETIEGTAVSTENGQTSESWFHGTLKTQ